MNDMFFKLVASGAGYAGEDGSLPRGKGTTAEARVMLKEGGKGTLVL